MGVQTVGDGWRLLIVSAIVMGISHTVSKERIFAPLRERLGGKDTWFGYLVACPYCVSHYVAFALVPLTGVYAVPIAFEWGWVGTALDWFLTSVLVVVIASFLRVTFYFVDETQGLTRRRQGVVDAENDMLHREVDARAEGP